jgi:hypothetical protein
LSRADLEKFISSSNELISETGPYQGLIKMLRISAFDGKSIEVRKQTIG